MPLVNLQNLNQSLMGYSQDYDERFPVAANFEAVKPLLYSYHKDSTNYVDPNTKIPFEWNSYFSGKILASEDFTGLATFYVVVSIVPNARPVATFNGIPKLATDAEWALLKTVSHIP